MLAGDTARPPSREVAFERLGLADAFERRAARAANHLIETLADAGVGRWPVAIILPCFSASEQPHRRGAAVSSMSLCSSSSPAAALSIERSRRSAFAGLRRRCRGLDHPFLFRLRQHHDRARILASDAKCRAISAIHRPSIWRGVFSDGTPSRRHGSWRPTYGQRYVPK